MTESLSGLTIRVFICNMLFGSQILKNWIYNISSQYHVSGVMCYVGQSTNICFAFLLCSELMLIYSPFYNWAAQAIGRLVPGCNTMMNVPIRIIFCQTAAEARTQKNRAGRPISSNNLIYWQNKLGFTETIQQRRSKELLQDHILQCIMYFQDLCWNLDWNFSQTLLDIIYLFYKILIKY